MLYRPILFTIAALALSARPATAADAAAAGLDFFEKKVRLLLAERCLECHSPEKKVKGGLRLDSRDGWAKGGDTGPAIMPGDLDKSLFIEAIRYGNRDLQMPPKKRLADAERAVFEEWVKMGAPDPRAGEVAVKKQTGLSLEEGRKFWSYAPVRKPAVPAVKDTAWPRNDLDRFILAKIETAGLRPAPDAAPDVLVRRLCYNLIGLPPTPEQVDAFIHASRVTSRAALENLVDELLASPRFGETWGRHWLDVARFAE